MESELASFINEEAKRRGWSLREVARRGKISHGAIINVANGTDAAGLKTCAALALAFDMPEERIWKLAGLVPDYGEILPEVKAWSDRLRALSEDQRARAIELIELALRIAEGRIGDSSQPR